MQLDETFDASTVPPSEAFDVIPAGEYPACITASEIQATKAGTGRYVKLEVTITEGEFSGRKVWTNLNLWNPNAQAVEIARRDLSAICHAINVARVDDTDVLHDKPLVIKVKIRPARDGYNAQNEISGWKPANGAAPVAAVAKPAAAGAKPAGAAPPWRKTA